MFGYTKMGYSIRLDHENRKLIFDVIEGRDLTQGQSSMPRMVFRYGEGDLSEVSYVDDRMTAATVGYAGGEGQDEDRLIYQVGSGSGWGRREIFLDCGGAEIDELIETGNAKLADAGPKVSLNAVIATKPKPLGADPGFSYGLGDFVTVLYRNIRLDTQITEITEVHEHSGTSVSYVFGSQAPTINEQVYRPKEVR